MIVTADIAMKDRGRKPSHMVHRRPTIGPSPLCGRTASRSARLHLQRACRDARLHGQSIEGDVSLRQSPPEEIVACPWRTAARTQASRIWNDGVSVHISQPHLARRIGRTIVRASKLLSSSWIPRKHVRPRAEDSRRRVLGARVVVDIVRHIERIGALARTPVDLQVPLHRESQEASASWGSCPPRPRPRPRPRTRLSVSSPRRRHARRPSSQVAVVPSRRCSTAWCRSI